MYSVISVIVDSLPENTKNRESTRLWCDWSILGRIELIQGSPKTRIPSGRGNLAFGSIRISIGNRGSTWQSHSQLWWPTLRLPPEWSLLFFARDTHFVQIFCRKHALYLGEDWIFGVNGNVRMTSVSARSTLASLGFASCRNGSTPAQKAHISALRPGLVESPAYLVVGSVL